MADAMVNFFNSLSPQEQRQINVLIVGFKMGKQFGDDSEEKEMA